ncbi:MAG: radical SAM protein [bacterium]|nr:radical SAM protein [bacterium]
MKPKEKKKKILLGLMPFWTPLIPPMAISYLKSYLEKRDYEVSIVDLNIDIRFKEYYHKYFNLLKEFVVAEKRVNFYNIGHDVLQNHMTAHINYTDEEEYIALVKILVERNYFVTIDTQQVRQLNKIFDEFYAVLEKYLIRLIDEEKPDIFGLTVYNHTLPASLFAFKRLKEMYPHIQTVMGGGIFMWQLPLGSSELEFFLEKTKDSIDKVFIGEGQDLFYKYLEGELPLSQRVYTLKDIGMKRLDFTMVGFPDHKGLHVEQYPYLAGYASSSCPFECRFCTIKLYYGEFRSKNYSQVLEELLYLYDKFGKQVILLMDALVNPMINELSEEFLKHETALYWDAYLRVGDEVSNIDNTVKWRQAGFYRARIGVESGSQRILDMMDKVITLDQIRKSLAALSYAGIKTTTFWVIGYPGETEEDFQKTLNFLEELKDDIYEAEFNPFTYFYAGQVEHGEWVKKAALLYPESARDMLISQTWIVDTEPSREVMFDRLNRFVEHCSRLGVPNPYSMDEIYQADERWKKLHPNAAPALATLEDSELYIDECKRIEKLLTVQKPQLGEMDFGF